MIQPAGYNATRRALLLTASCFYRTLGSVIEDRAGSVSYCLLCVRCNRHCAVLLAAVLCCCCSDRLQQQQSSSSSRQPRGQQSVPTWFCVVACLYDMWHAHCCCCLYCCVVELNDTPGALCFPTTSVSIPYHSLIVNQVQGITKNRSYNHNDGHRIIQHCQRQKQPSIYCDPCSEPRGRQ